MRKTVALIYGGRGCEHEISVLGSKNFKKLIDKEKYRLIEIFIDKSGDWYLITDGESYPTFPVKLSGKSGFLHAGGVIHCDVAFPLLHGDCGEDGTVQGTLITAGIGLAGEGCGSSALALDKINTKIIAEACGIPTAKFVALRNVGQNEAKEKCESLLGYPLFIKPNSLGSSYGACAVHTAEEFDSAYKAARALSRDIIAEELIVNKRELEVAYLNTALGEIISHPAEIIIGGTYGFTEKYKKLTQTRTVAEVGSTVASTLKEYTVRLAHLMGICRMARFDYFLAGDKILLNEINTMPGFTDSSLYLAMLKSTGIPEERAIKSLIDAATEHSS